MELTAIEWNRIKYVLKKDQAKYEKMLKGCEPSDEEDSSYQIFKKQAEETAELIKKIEEAKV